MSTCATILTVPPVGVRLRRVDGELRITASGRLSLALLGIGGARVQQRRGWRS